MLIIVDRKIPPEAYHKLSNLGIVLGLETSNITYEAISGHPDIFFFLSDTHQLVVAPNLPIYYKIFLEEIRIEFIMGSRSVGSNYPETARYCAVCNNRYFVHHLRYSDPTLLWLFGGKELIHVAQGYTRCSLIFLDENHAITSDLGVFRQLQKRNIETFYFNPKEIVLPGLPHGFIGGTCGIVKRQIYFLGNPLVHPQGKALDQFIHSSGVELISLCNGPLFDGGGIFFIDLIDPHSRMNN